MNYYCDACLTDVFQSKRFLTANALPTKTMSDKFVLYQDPWCPFCGRVTSFMQSNQISIPIKDTAKDMDAYRELVQGGGRATVPCLRITAEDESVSWLYESADIIDLLRRELT